MKQNRPSVRKAKSDPPPLVAVYDANKRLVGVVDPEKITRISDAGGDSVDLTPVPSGEVGTPADGVAKRLRKSVYGASTPAEQNRAAAVLNAAAITGLRQIHAAPGR